MEGKIMKKYFIRAFFSDWHETTKEVYEDFRKHILVGALNVKKSDKQEVERFLSRHSKIEEVII
jgi:septin family protein